LCDQLFQSRLFKSAAPIHVDVHKLNFSLELEHVEVVPNLYESLWLFNIFEMKTFIQIPVYDLRGLTLNSPAI